MNYKESFNWRRKYETFINNFNDIMELLDSQAEGVAWDEFYDLRKHPANFIIQNDVPDENPEYPEEFYAGMVESEISLFDIHAGGYETAMMKHYFNELVNEEVAQNLKTTSLTDKELEQWGIGGETTRTLVPLGYAGNPAGYKNIDNIDSIEEFTVEYTAKRIIESLNG